MAQELTGSERTCGAVDYRRIRGAGLGNDLKTDAAPARRLLTTRTNSGTERPEID